MILPHLHWTFKEWFLCCFLKNSIKNLQIQGNRGIVQKSLKGIV